MTSRQFLFVAALSFLPATAAVAQPATVILVRHAERAAEPRRDPVLTEAGTARAEALRDVLRDAGVTSVVTTQLQRTQLTAKPLADQLGLQPIIVPVAGPVAAHVDSVAAAVMRRPAGDVVLVVGHSNTIPAIVGALGGPRMPELCETEYSWLFVMEFAPGKPPRTIRATFGAPSAPAPADCNQSMR